MTARDAYLPPIGDPEVVLAMLVAGAAERLTLEEIEAFVGLGAFIGKRMVRKVLVVGSVD